MPCWFIFWHFKTNNERKQTQQGPIFMSVTTYTLSSGKVQGDRLWVISFVNPLVGEMSDEIIELK